MKNEQTQNPIDFSKMKQKKYETVKQFEEDLKWFEHNCRTIFSQMDEIREASKRLIGFVRNQIEIIQACEECYENQQKHGQIGFSMACSKPHLLLWAADEGYGFLPAKVLAVNIEKNEVFVRYFGEHTKDTMLGQLCYLFSKEHPIELILPRTKAMKVS